MRSTHPPSAADVSSEPESVVRNRPSDRTSVIRLNVFGIEISERVNITPRGHKGRSLLVRRHPSLGGGGGGCGVGAAAVARDVKLRKPGIVFPYLHPHPLPLTTQQSLGRGHRRRNRRRYFTVHSYVRVMRIHIKYICSEKAFVSFLPKRFPIDRYTLGHAHTRGGIMLYSVYARVSVRA